jgi:hypothetical protein
MEGIQGIGRIRQALPAPVVRRPNSNRRLRLASIPNPKSHQQPESADEEAARMMLLSFDLFLVSPILGP